MEQQRSTLHRLLVWDLPTRAFHWALALLVAFSWWSGEQAGDWLKWHFWSGYAVLTLVIFRLVWGLVGSSTARFSHFIKGPKAGLAHIREMFGPHAPGDLGHNPVGGWMVVALLLVLLTQATLGLFADDDILTTGPLNHLVPSALGQRLTGLHQWGGKIILWLVILHVSAVAIYYLWKRQNLLRPMIDGHKQVPADLVATLKFASPILALVLLVSAALLVWLLIALLGN